MTTTKTTTTKKTAEKVTATATKQANEALKTAEKNAEAFTQAGEKAFKEGFERATETATRFSTHGKENMDALVESMTVAAKGVEEINTQFAAYAKESVEGSVETAKNLASAKRVQDLIEIQSDFAKSAMDRYVSEIAKTSDLMTAVVKDAWAPLNTRASKAVEDLQA